MKHPKDNWSYFDDLDNKAYAQERKIVQDARKMVKSGKAGEKPKMSQPMEWDFHFLLDIDFGNMGVYNIFCYIEF